MAYRLRNHYEVINDTWVFDYGMVVKECPEYVRYCYDKNAPVEEDPNTIDLTSRTNYRAEREDRLLNTTDPEGVLTPMGGHRITDDDELNIIRQISEGEDEDYTPDADTHDEDDLFGNIYIQQYASESDSSEGKEAEPDYLLDISIHDENLFAGEGDPGVPLLPAPKHFLANGSEIWYGNYQRYHLSSPMRCKDPNVVDLHKDVIYIKPGGVVFVKSTYYFDRLKNFTQERKKSLQFVSFSMKTLGLYWISWMKGPGAKRYTKMCRRIGMRQSGVEQTLSKMPERIRNQFVWEIVSRASRTIDGLVIPDISDQENYGMYLPRLLTAVLWQLKARKPLKWIENRILMSNLSTLLDHRWINWFGTMDLDPIQEAMHDTTRVRRAVLRRLHNAVRKHNSPKPLLKALLGPCYTDLFAKILMTYSMDNSDSNTFGHINLGNAMIGVTQATANHGLSKNAMHLLAQTFKAGEGGFGHFKTLINGLGYVANTRNISIHVFERWIQFNRTMFESYMECHPLGTYPKHYDAVDWGRFRDTMDMAEQLSLRIRLNKYDRQTFGILHDRLAQLVTRDTHVRRDMPLFLPFAHPDKEYDGFRFVHLDTAQALVDEGREMKHCVASYSRRCYSGESLIFSMRNGRSWITIEVDGSTNELGIRQKYTIGDFSVRSSKFKQIIDEWHKDLKDLHILDKVPYQSLADAAVDLIDARKSAAFFQSGEELPQDVGDEEVLKQAVETALSRITKVESDLKDMDANIEEIENYVSKVEQEITSQTQQGEPRPA